MFDLETHPLRENQGAYLRYIAWLMKDPKNVEEEIRRCAIDPWWFVAGWVKTLYEKGKGLTKAKRFPIRNYFVFIIEKWQTEPLLAIIKSRQLMMTWLFSALYLWDIMFHHGRMNLLHTLNEDKAGELIDRIGFIYENLPNFLKWAEINKTKCGFEVNFTGSQIRGLPMGPDAVRSFAASKMLEDEAQSQKDLREGIGAALPAIMGQIQGDGELESGSINLVGTASAGEWQELLFILEEENPVLSICAEDFWLEPENRRFREKGADGIVIPMRGIRTWKTKEGYFVIELHYTADPDKDPFTENGKKWYDQGVKDYLWRREMGIDFSAGKGARVFPGFNMQVHTIKAKDWKVNPNKPKLESIDFGIVCPAGVIAQFNDDGQLVICGEITRPGFIIFDFLQALKQYSDDYYKCASRLVYCDPHGESKNEMSHLRAVDVIFNVMKVWPNYERSHIDDRIVLISRLLMPREKDGKPSLLVVEENCPLILKMFMNSLVIDPKSGKNPTRTHPYIDLFDALGYLVIKVFDFAGYSCQPGETDISDDDDDCDYENAESKTSNMGGY